jgi:glycosyltransferase involved in cell wall biosynthesis
MMIDAAKPRFERRRRGRSKSRRTPGCDVVFHMPLVRPLVLRRRDEPPAGGAEIQILMLSQELARRGWRVGMVVQGTADELPDAVNDVRIIPERPSRRRAPVVRTIEHYLRVIGALRAIEADVVVRRGASSTSGLVAVVAKLRGQRFVYSSANVIDFDFDRLERRAFNVWLFSLGVRLADLVVVQTLEQEELCGRRFGRSAVTIKSIAEPAEARHRPAEAFLWIGRLTSYKRPDAYLELARAVPEASFWMVGVPAGPGWEQTAAHVEIAARDIPNLELLSPRPRAELDPLIEKAVAMVNTADYEGMPNVLLESWSRGVPALSLSHDPDGVIEGEGLGGFAGGSPERLAELAREMWRSRHDQAAAARSCREYVAREHSLESAVVRWEKALLSLGAGRPASVATASPGDDGAPIPAGPAERERLLRNEPGR